MEEVTEKKGAQNSMLTHVALSTNHGRKSSSSGSFSGKEHSELEGLSSESTGQLLGAGGASEENTAMQGGSPGTPLAGTLLLDDAVMPFWVNASPASSLSRQSSTAAAALPTPSLPHCQ